MTIATWNAGWISKRSGKFDRAVERISELDADILVLTELTLDLVPKGGHVVLGGDDWGYPLDENRRKVALWSKWPVEEVETELVEPPGRHLGATVSSPFGPLRIHAVCVPWRDAHVFTGRRDASPWSEHLVFLESLGAAFQPERSDPRLSERPLILAGDFNQRDGRNAYGNDATRTAWANLLEVAGLHEATPSDVIDRIAVSDQLQSTTTSTFDPDGISDHHAVVSKVAFS